MRSKTIMILAALALVLTVAGCDINSPSAPSDIQASLSCKQLPTPPLTVECTTDASSAANWFTFDWGDGNSTRTAGASHSHVYTAAGTYTISVLACEFEEPNGNCGTDDVPLEVT